MQLKKERKGGTEGRREREEGMTHPGLQFQDIVHRGGEIMKTRV